MSESLILIHKERSSHNEIFEKIRTGPDKSASSKMQSCLDKAKEESSKASTTSFVNLTNGINKIEKGYSSSVRASDIVSDLSDLARSLDQEQFDAVRQILDKSSECLE